MKRTVGHRLAKPLGRLGGGQWPLPAEQADERHPQGVGIGAQGFGIAQGNCLRKLGHVCKDSFRKLSLQSLIHSGTDRLVTMIRSALVLLMLLTGCSAGQTPNTDPP